MHSFSGKVLQFLRSVLFVMVLLSLVVFLLWVTSEDPQYNSATFEESALSLSIAPQQEAITLAQFIREDGQIATLLVESFDGEQVGGIDLRSLGAEGYDDPFAAFSSVERAVIGESSQADVTRVMVDIARLLPSGPAGQRHLGTGTNFPEHAAEANSDAVFHFPKFGRATPARTTVVAKHSGLLDYEVELCMRFDRPVSTLADFDAALKGVFLCADFTDRIALIQLADPDNLDSGYGFSDAKSGPGFFPTGPFLVIPTDWADFVTTTRMMTRVNGSARQDARGGEMTLNFRDLAARTLKDMSAQRFYYDGAYFKLAPESRINRDMALMSGTSEGVIFTPPQRHDYIEIGLSYVLSGAWLSGQALMEYALNTFIESEVNAGHFLQPGDEVRYQASYLGDIIVSVQ